MPKQVLRYAETFKGCKKLKNIVFEGVIGNNINFQWSTLLTKESITSIVEHLAGSPMVGNIGTLTLSKTAVDVAFKGSLVWDDELGTTVWDDTVPGSESYDWEILIAPKVEVGWTITLV